MKTIFSDQHKISININQCKMLVMRDDFGIQKLKLLVSFGLYQELIK